MNTITITIPDPRLIASAGVVVILFMAWGIRALGRHFYGRGWRDCQEAHIDFCINHEKGVRERV